jgi:dynein heavy chain
MVKPVSVPSDEVFYKLWLHESFRVFYDRLINDSDREWFKTLCLELLMKNFRQNPDKEDLYVNNKVMFGDLLKLDSPTQFYELLTDKTRLLKVLNNSLEDYNMSNPTKMNLILFDDALEHIIRIGRVLK